MMAALDDFYDFPLATLNYGLSLVTKRGAVVATFGNPSTGTDVAMRLNREWLARQPQSARTEYRKFNNVPSSHKTLFKAKQDSSCSENVGDDGA